MGHCPCNFSSKFFYSSCGTVVLPETLLITVIFMLIVLQKRLIITNLRTSAVQRSLLYEEIHDFILPKCPPLWREAILREKPAGLQYVLLLLFRSINPKSFRILVSTYKAPAWLNFRVTWVWIWGQQKTKLRRQYMLFILDPLTSNELLETLEMSFPDGFKLSRLRKIKILESFGFNVLCTAR